MTHVSRVVLTAALLAAPCLQLASAQARATQPAPAGGQRGAAPAVQLAQRSAGAGPVLIIETVKGAIQIETYPDEAPKTVEHIMALAKRNFYNGLRVHRVEPGFVVQFGDPQTRDMTKRALWGTGNSGRPIGVGEMNPKRTHRLGAVAMAHSGDPARADSQMYITLRAVSQLDGKYTVFGQVIAGMDVVRQLAVTDIIRRVTVQP
ncbi:MAG: peptidylprolyl isomerase [Acidobacteria bacterium]|nr:peptidylprolyl isomerase [Acidobacteriota bacterium]